MISAGLISFGRATGSDRPAEAGVELAGMLAAAALEPAGLEPIFGMVAGHLEGRLVGRGPAAPGEDRPVPARAADAGLGQAAMRPFA